MGRQTSHMLEVGWAQVTKIVGGISALLLSVGFVAQFRPEMFGGMSTCQPSRLDISLFCERKRHMQTCTSMSDRRTVWLCKIISSSLFST